MILRRCLVAFVIIVGTQAALPGNAAADNIRDAQWHLAYLGMSDAQSISRGNGVTVGLVDTGVDASHPDLSNAVASGSEVGGVGDGRSDSDGHGTSMAGLIAARGRTTSIGALGIAPGSIVIPIKIRDQRPLTVAAAIDQASVRGVKVICLALGTSGDRELEAAVNRARAADIVVVASAGNAPGVGVQAPARYSGVVAAVGVDRTGNHAAISVTGPEAMLAAPAEEVISTSLSGGYDKGKGTSAAAAIIAGVVALIRSKFPTLDATEVVHRMTATAIDKGNPGRDKEYGYGVVNPVAALTADIPPLSISPSPGSTAPSADIDDRASAGNNIGPVLGLVAFLVGLAGLALGFVLLIWRAKRHTLTK